MATIPQEERQKWVKEMKTNPNISLYWHQNIDKLLGALEEAEAQRDKLADMLCRCSENLCVVCESNPSGSPCVRFRHGFYDALTPQDYINVAIREITNGHDHNHR
jgi:hypothetical protein